MKQKRLQELLSGMGKTRVAVLGDFCLDAYWVIDPSLSEVSVETGLSTRPVHVQNYTLGGAGNIVANLADLGVEKVFAIGVVGDDLFGREILRLLAAIRTDTSGVATQSADWATPTYGKPYLREDEQERVDFGVYNQLASETETQVLQGLKAALPHVGAVIVNQQLPRGINTDRVIDGINALTAAEPDKIFIVDSRDRSERYEKVIYRFNAHEAARLCGKPKPLDQMVLLDEGKRFARSIHERTGRAVFISRGDRGGLVCWNDTIHEIPGLQILKKTDPVGAGDTSVSTLAAALAAGADPFEAGELANFASAVTVQKLQTTGTAGPKEILTIGSDPDYIYRPELASDPREAKFFQESESEIVTEARSRGDLRHALFDHDGTISTLRQGWEPIMERMFIRSILGPLYTTADESEYGRVADRVREYIDRSTGIQTIAQMQALVEMVREFGYVPEDRILDRFGYKKTYLAALMTLVRQRLEKLQRGELDVGDFSVKGAVKFLHALSQRGITLYLASGTDHEDVVREARALGYANLFDGGIYGAKGDIGHDAKKQVVERILRENDLTGESLVCFGDGPVELREGKKRGGLAVGVASDEIRRWGKNPDKRTRLIRAGADLIIPDFSQPEPLLEFLFE